MVVDVAVGLEEVAGDLAEQLAAAERKARSAPG
jgi:hypothetical protein